MHIIMRYEIERGLLDGSIKVSDVPSVWNDKMQQYLGAVPENDAQGCLQVCGVSYQMCNDTVLCNIAHNCACKDDAT